MRIAFVSTMDGSPWGGSEELWRAGAEKAIAAGHSVFVSVQRHATVPEQIRLLEARGAQVDFRRKAIHPRIDAPLAGLGLRFGALSRFEPDVVCLSQGASYDLAIRGDCEELRRWLETGGTPLVIVCQLNHDHAALGDTTRHTAAGLFARAHRVAFVAERNLRQARRHLSAEIPNGVVVRNPVNLSSSDPVGWPDDREGARWASVARLDTAYKGQDALLEALSEPSWRDRPWRLGLFGTGHDDRYLRALAAHYGLIDRVEFAGHVSDVRAIWARHHMLLLPSREEGTPLSMVEAMLCGRPALVTDVAGNTEWVRDGENGFVAPAARAGALHAALERAWSRRSEWRTLGQAARLTAIGQVDPESGTTLLNMLLSAAKTRG